MGLFSSGNKDVKKLDKLIFNVLMTFYMRNDPSHLAPEARRLREVLEPDEIANAFDDFWSKNGRMLSEEWHGADLEALGNQTTEWILTC